LQIDTDMLLIITSTNDQLVSRGFVLGPLMFAAYVAPVGEVIKSFGVRCQQYADDTQLYLSMRTSDSAHHHSRRTTCVLDGGA